MEQSRSTGPLVGKRVLVVEDEPLLIMALTEVLNDAGCEIVGLALSCAQAVALVGALDIDVAVLDLNLGGERSYGVADALLARGVPFVIATGYSADRIPDTLKGRPTLSKPYTDVDLKIALVRALDTP